VDFRVSGETAASIVRITFNLKIEAARCQNPNDHNLNAVSNVGWKIGDQLPIGAGLLFATAFRWLPVNPISVHLVLSLRTCKVLFLNVTVTRQVYSYTHGSIFIPVIEESENKFSAVALGLWLTSSCALQ
jgi:hypothetical protein